MARILLVGPILRHRSFNGANKALPVLASALMNSGRHKSVQMDLERSDLKIDHVKSEAEMADVIAFAGTMSTQLPDIDRDTQEVYQHLQTNGKKDVPIILGGYAVKGIDQGFAKEMPQVTAFFNGEGEDAIVQIADSISRGTFRADMPKIRGLCFLDSAGNWHYSTAHRVRNFDNIDQNYGLNHILEKHDMDIFRVGGRQLKTAQLFTQRGCPWDCEYCNKSTEGDNVAWLSEESLRIQLQALRREGYEAVYLDVDTFTVNRRRTMSEAKILNKEGFVWGSNTRIDMIDRTEMEHFVCNGCVYMFFGVEHVLPEVSLAIGKFNGSLDSRIKQARQYPEKVKDVFRAMEATGLPSSYFLILGLPKARLNHGGTMILGFEPTTFEDDLKAIEFGLQECNPDYLNLNVLRFMPGTLAADIPNNRVFSVVRPTGNRPITAGHFVPRIAEKLGYTASNHPAYLLSESIEPHQPISTAVDAERLYRTVETTMKMINARIDRGKKPTRLFIDKQILEEGLVGVDESGRYTLAPLKEFENI